MAIGSARKVLRLAQTNTSFRDALRSNPRAALESFSAQIGMTADDQVTDQELGTLAALTDQEFSEINSLWEGNPWSSGQ